MSAECRCPFAQGDRNSALDVDTGYPFVHMESTNMNNLIRLSEILQNLDPYRHSSVGRGSELIPCEVTAHPDSSGLQESGSSIELDKTKRERRGVGDLAIGDSGFVDSSAVWVNKVDDTAYVEADALVSREASTYTVGVRKDLSGVRLLIPYAVANCSTFPGRDIVSLLPVTKITEDLPDTLEGAEEVPCFWRTSGLVSAVVFLILSVSAGFDVAACIYRGEAPHSRALTVQCAFMMLFGWIFSCISYHYDKRHYYCNRTS